MVWDIIWISSVLVFPRHLQRFGYSTSHGAQYFHCSWHVTSPLIWYLQHGNVNIWWCFFWQFGNFGTTTCHFEYVEWYIDLQRFAPLTLQRSSSLWFFPSRLQAASKPPWRRVFETYQSSPFIYTLWWTNKKLWKDPPFLMGTSTISMAIFNCYVGSPEGIKKKKKYQ